jgi:hypothetical protein
MGDGRRRERETVTMSDNMMTVFLATPGNSDSENQVSEVDHDVRSNEEVVEHWDLCDESFVVNPTVTENCSFLTVLKLFTVIISHSTRKQLCHVAHLIANISCTQHPPLRYRNGSRSNSVTRL